ncbi:hypothetical protein MP228_000603 [Amoeboaphelidium protococcarum]|nr:hypothetical protein MP228_000603 [Amoeboaphelidium protococcarum]
MINNSSYFGYSCFPLSQLASQDSHPAGVLTSQLPSEPPSNNHPGASVG